METKREKERRWARESYHRRIQTTEGRRKHREKVNRAAKRRRENGKHNQAMRDRRNRDPGFKLTDNLRRRLNATLVGFNKTSSVMMLVGCGLEELKHHLESKFEPWMNWGNYGRGIGKWVIDHIKPCAVFRMDDPVEMAACFNYTNLRPLEWKENNRKSSKWTPCPS